MGLVLPAGAAVEISLQAAGLLDNRAGEAQEIEALGSEGYADCGSRW